MAVSLAACSRDGGSTSPPTVRLVVDGRIERGSTIAVAAWSGSDSVPGAQLQLTIQPTDAASAADGRVKLLRAGQLTITAKLPNGHTVTRVESVAVPPDIVLDMVVSGNRDLYRIALDGAGVTRLTTDAGDDSQATVAGGDIVFTTYRHGQGELYALPVAGGTERRLTTTPESEVAAALSADGRQLAFMRLTRGVAKVWIGDANAAGAQRLTADASATAANPEATPAWGISRRIAFVSTDRGQADIVTATTDALPATPTLFAASSSSADVEASWSADGTRLAFISTRDAAVPAMYVANAEGGGLVRVGATGIDVSQPAWLADGRIVFISRRPAGTFVAWLDPAAPSIMYNIPVSGNSPAHPAAIR